MYAVYNSWRNAYIDAPTAISRRYSFDPQVRAQARAEGQQRLEESRLIYYNLALAFGIDPRAYLPQRVEEFVRPRTQPWSMVWVPRYGYPLQIQLRDQVSQPTFLAGQIGGLLGNFTTVGTSLAIAHRLVLSAAPLPIKILFTPLLVGQVLGVLGRGEETERVYRQHLQQQSKLWPWQQAWTPYLSGIPRNMVMMEHQDRQAQRIWENFSVTQALFIAGGLILWRFLGPRAAQEGVRRASQAWRGSGGSPGTALMLRPSNVPAVMPTVQRLLRAHGATQFNLLFNPQFSPVIMNYLRQLFANAGGRNLPMVVQPRANALTIYRQAANALAPYLPSANALVPYVPRPNAFMPYVPAANALVPYMPNANALMRITPSVNALTLFQGRQRALALVASQAKSLAIFVLNNVKK